MFPRWSFLFLTTPPEKRTLSPESLACWRYSSKAYPLVKVYALTVAPAFFPFQTNNMYLYFWTDWLLLLLEDLMAFWAPTLAWAPLLFLPFSLDWLWICWLESYSSPLLLDNKKLSSVCCSRFYSLLEKVFCRPRGVKFSHDLTTPQSECGKLHRSF